MFTIRRKASMSGTSGRKRRVASSSNLGGGGSGSVAAIDRSVLKIPQQQQQQQPRRPSSSPSPPSRQRIMPELDVMREIAKREETEWLELGMIQGELSTKYASFRPKILAPMLAVPITDFSEIPFDGRRAYIYEEKYDGERMLCFVRDSDSFTGAEFYSRTLKPMSFPFKIPLAPNYGNCVLDGELVFLDADTGAIVPICDTGDRSTLRKQYRVFDVQMINGEYVVNRPLIERKALLEEILVPSQNVVLAPYRDARDLETLMRAFARTLETDGEGLMLKRANGSYASNARKWIKIKSLHIIGRKFEVDLYVNRMLKDKNEILSVLECGYYDELDTFVRVCLVASGLDAKNRTRIRRLSKLGHFSPRELVVTVVADKITKNGSLRHPTFHGIRRDLSGARLNVDPRLIAKRKKFNDQ